MAGLILLGGVGYLFARPSSHKIPSACTATVGKASYTMTPEQARNASTIAAQAHNLALPAHAVSVGIATALQESKLRNLGYGDRDSLGLFQQRPSQGWGEPTQLLDPDYAAAAFFKALAKIPHWEMLDLEEAAQKVQRSADGSAYAVWEAESRVIARGLTGQSPAGFDCTFPDISPGGQAPQVAAALGTGALEAGIDSSYGWTVASWLISRAPEFSLRSVHFSGWTWTAHDGWARDPKVIGTQVTYELRF